jgi:hypothetical protein
MDLLFRSLYELRAEEAARGGAPVVVVGPPGAGKTTFIKQFLETRGVEAAEETAGLAPEAEEARGGGLRERAVRLLRGLAGRGYVPRDRVERELAGIRGAELLKAFDELPRSFVEHLRERYGGYALYLFHIPPDVEEEREAVEKLLEVAKKVGVEFRWLGLRYVPPGVVAMLRERGERYVEEQLRLYRRIVEEFGAAGDKLSRLSRLGEGAAKKAGKSLLETLAGPVAELAAVLLPPIPGGATARAVLSAAGAVLGVASFFLASEKKWGDWIRLLADWSRLDGRLRDLAAAHVALGLGLDRGRVREVLDGLAAAGGRLKALESEFSRLSDEVKRMALKAMALEHGVAVHFLPDVEGRGLYVNFYVKERPYLESREPSGPAAVPLVEGGRFGELAAEALRRLEEEGAVVLVGPKGVGKSTLAAYVVWKALRGGRAYGVVKVAGGVGTEAVLRALAEEAGAELIALYDPSPPEVYYDPDYVKLTKAQQVGETLKELGALAAVERRVKVLAVLPRDLYGAVLKKAEEPALKLLEKRLEVDLRDVRFLADVVHEYSKCGGMPAGVAERLAEKIAEFDGGYTLAAKYAGLWLKGNGCRVESVERALEASRKGPKLFFAFYIRDVLLWRSSEEERVRLMYRAAAPLLLHAVFGPVPEGVTYITQAKSDGTFYQPEEIEKLTQPQWDLLKAGLQPIAHWLAQRHEDLVEEVLEDLAGLHDEEAREQYREGLGDLIRALDWARGEMLKEGGEILAELGVPEEDRELGMSLLAFVNRRLAAVFKGGEGKRCWERAALIVGHALATRPVLPRREWLPEDVAEALGEVLKPCAVDAYLTIDGKIPPLSIYVAQLAPIRELNILSPLADAETIKAVKKTAEELAARWRRRGFGLPEALYALGLAALAAGGEADGGTADLLLHAASSAVQRVARPAAVLPVLAALRPLGEKAPHRYVVALTAASELETLNPVTAQYIYDALQRHKDRLLEAERRWPLVDAVDAYSNLLTKHSEHIRDRLKDAVADMCRLYNKVRKRGAAAAPNGGLSAQRLLSTAARAYVLAAALYSDVLAPLVREHCGLGDLVKKANAVRKTLKKAAARPDELGKIAESDADFAEWVVTRSPTGDAGGVVERLRGWFTYQLALYKLSHALNEGGELDAGKLEEAAKGFGNAAKIDKKLEQWRNYLAARGSALRAHVLAAGSWRGLLKRAKGFRKLCRKAEGRLEPTAEYLEAAASTLGECLVYLAASGDRERAEDLLKGRRWLLDYDPRVSVVARLMLRLFGVGEGARQGEVVVVFGPLISPEFRPALSMLAGRLQIDKVPDECAKSPKAELCDAIVAAAAGNRVVAERLRSEIERVVPEARPLLGKADGRTLVEVLAPGDSPALLAFMLLAAVEGRADAVRLHGLWGSARLKEPLPQRLFRAVYESCSDLNGEGCRLALLKLYYHHF